MSDGIRDLLENLVGLLFQRRFHGMLKHIDLPLAIQVDGDMTAIPTPASFAEVMTIYCEGLTEIGVTEIAVRQTAIELPRKGRFRLWAEMDHLRPEGVTQGADQIILYCRQEGAGFRIELIHCVRLAFLAATAAQKARMA
ncbi:MAG: hypothetical protein NTX73_12350 [Rhodobacterales bacterium]|nr:hypothetical protein [Rhodobacterales bacterium]